KEVLSSYCVSPMAKQRAMELVPKKDVEEACWSFDFISELKTMLSRSKQPDMKGLHDISEYSTRASKEGILSGEQLWKVKEVVDLSERLLKIGRKECADTPILKEYIQNLVSLFPLNEQIERYIEPEGEIKSNATPLMVKLNKQYDIVRERIQSKLGNYLTSKKYSTFMQEFIITHRQGRFVIPIKAAYKEKIPGVIHDRSTSGATLFIEPFTVVRYNNEIREHELAIKAEKERILRFLSGVVASKSHEIRGNLEHLTTLDFYASCAFLSIRWDGTPPEFSKDGYFYLKKAYHPLLLEEEGKKDKFKAVPLSLELDPSIRALIVTGPNMGGKTVAAKTIGLLSLMSMLGLHLPVAPDSKLPFFKSIYADIGDEQSIEFSLSSFASHVKNWRESLENADEHSLVVLDELGSSTAPEEGAPLAVAVLDKLVEKRVRVIATTHLGTLKTLASKREAFLNGAMEFDLETLQPSYRLRVGSPGRSWAFQIAQALGLPEDIVNKGYKLLSADEIKIDTLTKELEEQIVALQKQNEIANENTKEINKLKKELETLVASNKEKEKELKKLKNVYEKEKTKVLDEFLHKERKRISKMLEESPEAEKVQEVLDDLNVKIERVEKAEKLSRKKYRNYEKGNIVELLLFDKKGEVTAPPDKTGYMKVLIDDYTMKVHASEVEPANKPKQTLQKKKIHYEERKPSPSLNLLGLRFSEAQEKIEHYLDDAVVKEMDEVLIIHGKKVLKDKVREYLRQNDRVLSCKPAEACDGGDGATMVKLKK
ncbi:endonuclease MutS2, partial [bacterium]|nr:endonuclease MutS2 [bacterium]